MAKYTRKYVVELLKFYDRVQDDDGVRYVEKYPGSEQDWMECMKSDNHSAIAWLLKEMAAAFIQILVAVVMGK